MFASKSQTVSSTLAIEPGPPADPLNTRPTSHRRTSRA